jgi:hypothetical protein
MFVARRQDGSIFGAWTVQQFQGQEELQDGAPELIAFLNPPPDPRLVLDAEERAAAKIDAALMTLVNSTPAQLQTFAQNNFSSLTVAERNRMAIILNIIAIAVRPLVRNG